MAWKVGWSQRAQSQRKAIFEYWNQHNQSYAYSEKLDRYINDTINVLKEYPYLGRKTEHANVYVRIILNFQLYYKVRGNEITILGIRDGRRAPKK
ncbi:MAG: type toxin-antitoxin system RelE/ParE family toxin [Bacteroidetes bacterium]|nr:type toxin-antitoxin system RelE/ParE family toxin [Bacteroidota bacterium]